MRGSIGPVVCLAAGLGVAAVVARRVVERPDDFYAWRPRHVVVPTADGGTFTLPMTYHRTEQLVSIHTADAERVRARLPTDALHPVRLPNGRALVGLSAARYLEGTAEDTDPRDLPYAEMMITALVTREPAAPLVPVVRGMLAGGAMPPFGVFVLQTAADGRAARDTGRALGYPAFVADFAFQDDVSERRVRIAEGGREILRLRTSTRGRISVDRSPMIVYSARDGELLEAVCPCSGIVQQAMGRGAGHLELGDHPVADEFRALGLWPDPFIARCYLNLRILITAPRVVGTARPLTGYAGRDLDGTCTIAYPDGSMIDLHAITPPAAGERVPA